MFTVSEEQKTIYVDVPVAEKATWHDGGRWVHNLKALDLESILRQLKEKYNALYFVEMKEQQRVNEFYHYSNYLLYCAERNCYTVELSQSLFFL
jgi:hypothetical protein